MFARHASKFRIGLGLGLGISAAIIGIAKNFDILKLSAIGPASAIDSTSHNDIAELTIAAESRLPSLKSSQSSKVVRIEKFLSEEEIKELLEYANSNSGSFGKRRRDAKGVIKYKDDYTWETLFIHTDASFHTRFPDLLNRIKKLAFDVDSSEKWNLLPPITSDSSNNSNNNSDNSSNRINSIAINPRTIEIHEVLPNGGLPDAKHFDGGSLITVDVMLSAPEKGDFTGAEFTTPEYHEAEGGSYLQKHAFNQGDVLVFQSHKYHCIQPLKRGRRRVLVIEFWEGECRTCGHRCLKRFGDCKFTKADGQLEALVQGLADDL